MADIFLGTTRDSTETKKGIRQEDREAHLYVIGETRTGKSKFLENLIRQDIENGEGFGVIDPHGDLCNEVKYFLATYRSGLDKEVVLIDPTDETQSVSFNPLELLEGVGAAQLANELVLAFEKMYGTAWGARLEAILRNSLIVLIENELPLTEISLVIQNAEVREKLLRNVKNETCREYFRDEFDKWPERTRLEWVQSTTNKINAFFSDERIRRIFASPKSSFSLRDVMDNGKILLINLSKGDLGEKNSYLLGSLFLTKIQIEAMKRGRIRNKGKRRPFYLYIDEFQNFAGGNFTGIINETGKYNLSLIIANQSLEQLTKELRQSVLSCGLQAYFRVPRHDAELLAKEAYAGVFRLPPKWEDCFARLQSFPKGVCLIKSKSVGGIVEVKVPMITPAWEGMDDEKFEAVLRDARVGAEYLRDNAMIEKEYQARRETLLAGGKEPEKRNELYE